MFTGIIQAVGSVASLQQHGGDMRWCIHAGKLAMEDVNLGDSIAVSGVCLTVIEKSTSGFCADVSGETLRRTLIGSLAENDAENLEKALTLETRLGGHLVSGHVDGLGTVTARNEDGRSVQFSIEAPAELARYIAVKGSICVDGVSLPVTAVAGAVMELHIVPHTRAEPTLQSYQPGRRVHREGDLVARYLERLLLGDKAAQHGAGGAITRELLESCGFAAK